MNTDLTATKRSPDPPCGLVLTHKKRPSLMPIRFNALRIGCAVSRLHESMHSVSEFAPLPQSRVSIGALPSSRRYNLDISFEVPLYISRMLITPATHESVRYYRWCPKLSDLGLFSSP